jgi:hypothetical protein
MSIWASNCDKLDWHGVSTTGPDRARSDGKKFHPPGAFYGYNDEMIGFQPVPKKASIPESRQKAAKPHEYRLNGQSAKKHTNALRCTQEAAKIGSFWQRKSFLCPDSLKWPNKPVRQKSRFTRAWSPSRACPISLLPRAGLKRARDPLRQIFQGSHGHPCE